MARNRQSRDNRPGPRLDVRIVNDASVVVVAVGATGVASNDARLILRWDQNGDIFASIAAFLPFASTSRPPIEGI
jgi:hypothetical protein